MNAYTVILAYDKTLFIQADKYTVENGRRYMFIKDGEIVAIFNRDYVMALLIGSGKDGNDI